jgi:hypothetical protein
MASSSDAKVLACSLAEEPSSEPASAAPPATVPTCDASARILRHEIAGSAEPLANLASARNCAALPQKEPSSRSRRVFGAQRTSLAGRIVRTMGIVRARAKIGLHRGD